MDELHAEAFCPHYHRAVELIGRRWTGAIVRALMNDVHRFSDLVETVPGLSDKMLSERLKELEQEGVVRRRVYAETPVRIEYELTDKGRDLQSVIDAVSGWAGRWVAAPEAAGSVPGAPAVGEAGVSRLLAPHHNVTT